MKVLLVRPPITLKVARRLKPFLHLEPLALEIVAGGVDARHDVRILDLSELSSAQRTLEKTLRSYRPDVVGFSAFSNQAATTKQMAADVKRLSPQTLVIVGGVHATIAPEDLKLPGTIDLVVRGEGGTAMKALIEALERGERPAADAVFLPTDSPQFDELAKAPPPELPAFDEVPRPRRDLVRGEDYHCVWHGEPGERLKQLFPPTASVRTSVGCPNRCSFCVVHYLARGKYVQRTPEDVVEEIAAIRQDHIYFVDDEMFINRKRAMDLAELLIARGVKKQYISWARADTIVKHPEMFALWKKAGLSLLYVGLESLEKENLSDYKKGISPEANRRAVEILRELGIGLHAALMVNPDFEDADFIKVRKAIEFVAPAEVSFTVFSPPPGTDLWKETRSRFICPDPLAFYDCMHTLLPTKMPLKRFYSCYSLLWLYAFRENPWRRNGVRTSLRDKARFFYRGMRYGWALRQIYKDYPDFQPTSGKADG